MQDYYFIISTIKHINLNFKYKFKLIELKFRFKKIY
jgi:hypothetical protein